MAYSDEDYRTAMADYEAAYLRANGEPCKVTRGGQFMHIMQGGAYHGKAVRMTKLREMTARLNARAEHP